MLLCPSAQSQTLWRNEIPDAEINRAICNDGSAAVYYTDTALPTSAGAKIIVWLSGGSGCYDNTTCSERYDEDPAYVTAPNNTNFTADTVFLNSSYFNPAFHDYVHVLVPYCSSDFWQGTQEASSYTNDWHFYGLRSRHSLYPREVLRRTSSVRPWGPP